MSFQRKNNLKGLSGSGQEELRKAVPGSFAAKSKRKLGARAAALHAGRGKRRESQPHCRRDSNPAALSYSGTGLPLYWKNWKPFPDNAEP